MLPQRISFLIGMRLLKLPRKKSFSLTVLTLNAIAHGKITKITGRRSRISIKAQTEDVEIHVKRSFPVDMTMH